MYKGPSAHHPTIIGSFYHYFRGLSSPGFFIFIAPPSGETSGCRFAPQGRFMKRPPPGRRMGEKAPLVAQGHDILRRGGALLRPCPGGMGKKGGAEPRPYEEHGAPTQPSVPFFSSATEQGGTHRCRPTDSGALFPPTAVIRAAEGVGPYGGQAAFYAINGAFPPTRRRTRRHT